MIFRIFLLSVFWIWTGLKGEDGYVTVRLKGQFGNQLFQIATAFTYALDHDLKLIVPDLRHDKANGIPFNAEKVFLGKICSDDLPSPIQTNWFDSSINYNEIPDGHAVALEGWFQSEKYFKHRRKELLSLLAPSDALVKIILNKYPFLASNQHVVGIQIRDYRMERPSGDYHPTYGRSYYEKAMSHFPSHTIFLVSSNNRDFARECTEGLAKNIVYLNADYIEEFYTLTLCKEFIISNSTFGWWASWLSIAPEKTVIAPRVWFTPPFDNQAMTRDLFTPEFLVLESPHGS